MSQQTWSRHHDGSFSMNEINGLVTVSLLWPTCSGARKVLGQVFETPQQQGFEYYILTSLKETENPALENSFSTDLLSVIVWQ